MLFTASATCTEKIESRSRTRYSGAEDDEEVEGGDRGQKVPVRAEGGNGSMADGEQRRKDGRGAFGATAARSTILERTSWRRRG
jgi:hypothetical protein